MMSRRSRTSLAVSPATLPPKCCESSKRRMEKLPLKSTALPAATALPNSVSPPGNRRRSLRVVLGGAVYRPAGDRVGAAQQEVAARQADRRPGGLAEAALIAEVLADTDLGAAAVDRQMRNRQHGPAV